MLLCFVPAGGPLMRRGRAHRCGRALAMAEWRRPVGCEVVRMSVIVEIPSAVPTQSAAPALIEAQWLAAQPHLLMQKGRGGQAAQLRVVDLRWSAKGPPALARYREAHLPGAAFV